MDQTRQHWVPPFSVPMYPTHHNTKYFPFSVKAIFCKPLTDGANRNDLGRTQEANWAPKPDDRGAGAEVCTCVQREEIIPASARGNQRNMGAFV